jgi:hypothetical protein
MERFRLCDVGWGSVPSGSGKLVMESIVETKASSLL